MTARKCEGCGRALRRSTGPYGPVCARKLTGKPPGGRTASQGPRLSPELSRSPRRPPATPQPGQDQLPLENT